MKFLIGGGTGFIGKQLCQHLKSKGHEILLVSRTAGHGRITWDELKKSRVLPSCDGVVNLAGEDILNPMRRWNEEYKRDARDSRIGTNQILIECLKNAKALPSVFVATSAVGYYPVSETANYDEDYKLTPSTFLETLSLDWEESGSIPSEIADNVRHAIIRVGIVLGRDGGLIQRSIWPFWFGVGGRIGEGKQYFPWIHITDVIGIYSHALENPDVSGVLNAVAPDVCDNATFTKEFAATLNRPAIIPVPTFALNLVFSSERGQILTSGQKVIPKRTLDSGYSFQFPRLRNALENIVTS